jgi:ABC-type polysaccharide/polyol phosphate export permease
VARILLEGIGATISFIVLSSVFIAAKWASPPEDILKVILGWFLLAWFGGALALLLGSLSGRSELVDKLWHPASYLLFPLSGAAFMVDALPPVARDFLLWLPMVHGTELIRDGYFGSLVQTHYDIWYFAGSCAVLTALALTQERVVSRTVVPE